MKISEEQIKLADDLNKLYAHIKNGGDYSFDAVQDVKQEVMNNYGGLYSGIFGFLADMHMKHPNSEVVFVPSETGVNLRYMVIDEINFDQQGNMRKAPKQSDSSAEKELI